MSLFLVTFFLLYGGAQLYFFLKFKSAVALSVTTGAGIAFFLVVMTVAPVLVRVLEKQGLESTARLTAYAGYLWMGFLFLFFSSSLVLDICQGGMSAAGHFLKRDFSGCFLSQRAAFLIPLVWGTLTALYGYFEAGTIRVERIVLASPKIPLSIGRLTIVQISDVHLGLIVRNDRLKRILDKVKSAAPDILVSTGDMVDGQINGLTGLAEQLREVTPRFGKFAVTGNHEVYAGLEHSLDFMRDAGFKVLRGEQATVPGVITIAGVDDPVISRIGGSAPAEEQHLVSQLPTDTYTVLLKHRPAVTVGNTGHIDLQLSGHVHKGQLFPFNLVTFLFYPVRAGINHYPNNTDLYVSRGTGTWGPPLRFLAHPEVTVIELIPMSSSQK